MDEDKKVEVIYEGRIVRVPESFAKEEGLPIIKKSRIFQLKENVENIGKMKAKQKANKEKEELLTNFHTPIKWKGNNVASELIDNFHWYIKKERLKRNLSRKQLSLMIHESESSIKAIEYGTLPSDDFILVNKIQDVFGVNLRKDGKNFAKATPAPSLQSLPQSDKKDIFPTRPSHKYSLSKSSPIGSEKDEITGDNIELDELPEEE
ncbi:MAG: helix-turn-helix domain-containing protein [Nanoarchaeota archaeon]|nr:helix-turn-helix domain-containing protein [Nanoarchaeota archaeon]